MTTKPHIGIIGVGRLGSAIARGITKSECAESLLLLNRSVSRAETLAAELHNARCVSIEEMLDEATVILLAVKPSAISELCAQLRPYMSAKKDSLLISVASRPSFAVLSDALGAHSQLVRAMPSIAVAECSGVTALYAENDAAAKKAHGIWSQLGATLRVDSEQKFDAILGMTASGLGFLAIVAEGLVAGGVAMGLTEDEAISCVANTFCGAGAVLNSGELHPEQLRQQVASPGGTTMAGLAELEKVGAREAFSAAVQAAVARAKEL